MKLKMLLLTNALLIACGRPVTESSAVAETKIAETFKYDASKGYCVDANGKIGLSKVDLKALLKLDASSTSARPRISKVQAECADLAKLDLDMQVNTVSDRKNYVQMIDWNLRGANLNGANLSFGVLTNADLSGAQFDKAKLGYSNVSGKVDKATKVHSSCSIAGTEVSCVF